VKPSCIEFWRLPKSDVLRHRVLTTSDRYSVNGISIENFRLGI
jgi:hypothetical protein